MKYSWSYNNIIVEELIGHYLSIYTVGGTNRVFLIYFPPCINPSYASNECCFNGSRRKNK